MSGHRGVLCHIKKYIWPLKRMFLYKKEVIENLINKINF